LFSGIDHRSELVFCRIDTANGGLAKVCSRFDVVERGVPRLFAIVAVGGKLITVLGEVRGVVHHASADMLGKRKRVTEDAHHDPPVAKIGAMNIRNPHEGRKHIQLCGQPFFVFMRLYKNTFCTD